MQIPHKKEIKQIILSAHCINSDDKIPHGINYINLPVWKFYEAVKQILYDIFDKKYDELFNLYEQTRFRFQTLITVKSTGSTFKLITQADKTDEIKSLKITLITIFESNKISTDGVFSSKGKFLGKQVALKHLYLEKINQELIELPGIYLD